MVKCSDMLINKEDMSKETNFELLSKVFILKKLFGVFSYIL